MQKTNLLGTVALVSVLCIQAVLASTETELPPDDTEAEDSCPFSLKKSGGGKSGGSSGISCPGPWWVCPVIFLSCCTCIGIGYCIVWCVKKYKEDNLYAPASSSSATSHYQTLNRTQNSKKTNEDHEPF